MCVSMAHTPIRFSNFTSLAEPLHVSMASVKKVWSGNEHWLFVVKKKAHTLKNLRILRVVKLSALLIARDESGCVSVHTAVQISVYIIYESVKMNTFYAMWSDFIFLNEFINVFMNFLI